MIAGSLSGCIAGSVDPAGSHDYPARDAGALASGWLSPLLAVEIKPTGRATSDRDGAALLDPADERGESALGRPRIHGELLKLGCEVAKRRRQVHGQAARAAQPGMANLLAQSRAGYG